MKTKITFLGMLLLVAIFSVNATVWTVSNNANSPGQYTSVQAAIDAASNGDTILISGSPTSYGDFTINKSLTVIGPGYNANKQYNYPTTCGTIALDSVPNFYGASNTTISGLVVTGSINGYPNVAYKVNNVIIERNYISNVVYPWYSNNMIIKNNIIRKIGFQGADYTENLIISNNIILSTNSLEQFPSNTNNVLITNNVFITHDAQPGFISNAFLNNITLTNNIFYGLSPYNVSNQFCVWNNNITFGTVNDDIITTGNNSGGGNMIGVNPEFVNSGGAGVYVFDYAYDFHLQAGSPGENAGTDGTDIGIYGGMYPFPSGGDVPWQTSAMPNIPQIIEMNVLNSSIGIDGTLQIDVNARKQD